MCESFREILLKARVVCKLELFGDEDCEVGTYGLHCWLLIDNNVALAMGSLPHKTRPYSYCGWRNEWYKILNWVRGNNHLSVWIANEEIAINRHD